MEPLLKCLLRHLRRIEEGALRLSSHQAAQLAEFLSHLALRFEKPWIQPLLLPYGALKRHTTPHRTAQFQ